MSEHPVALADLPVAVRIAVLAWAAETVGNLPPAQIPGGLQRVARFTPVKRARLGAAALAQAVENDAGFRAAVAERVRATGAAEADAGQDPVRAAAIAHLLRLPAEAELIAAVRAEEPTAPGNEAELRRAVRYLEGELGRARSELAPSSRPGEGDPTAAVEKLQRRLREQGTRLRRAEEAAADAGRRADEELAGLRGAVDRLTDEVAQWQERARLAEERADRAQLSLGRVREQTGRHRATADRRLELLLTTAEGAVSGLRREWNLAGGGADPADVVAARLPGPAPTGESAAEPSRLYGWLGLPAAHLIVDGYNVSKTGYPELTLAQQRDRLVRSLAALAARTSAEVTVVFDGAAVAVPAGPTRGVRVLFSPPGVIADDVIRDLAAAEPAGRVLVVVSSDREVADRVRRLGARTAGSPVLLGLLG